MKALTHWQHYLGWTKTPFTILTNHANLLYWKAKLSCPPNSDQGDNDNQDQTLLKPKLFINTTHTMTIPESSKRNLMTLIHDHPMAGHPGHDETIRKATEVLPWTGMHQWIADYIKGCATCQQNKILTH